MINSYMASQDAFLKNGVDIELFDHVFPAWLEWLPKKPKNVLYGFSQKRALLKHMKKNPVDAVHIHTSRSFLFLKDVWLARAVKRRRRVPVYITVHVGAAETVFSRISFWKKRLIKWINRYLNRVIFLSNAIQKEFEALGMHPAKGDVVYNFHNLPALPATEQLPREAQLQLLFVGAIHREKGIMELLQALCEMPEADFHIDICGQLTDGTMQSEFDEKVSALGDKVSLHGYVSGAKKAALFSRADVLILPSYHEGLPLVVLEALASGCAIISTPVGATPEILNERNAIWTQVESIVEIKDAVLHFLKNANLLAAMQKENTIVGEQFSLCDHIEQLCRIYTNC